MSIKKILLLASMALAVVAFAAPAAQAHPEWYLNEETVEGEIEEVTLEGSLSSVAAVTSGPCNVTFEGTVFNENEMAGGVIKKGTIQEHCPVAGIPGCSFTPTLEIGTGWKITGITVTEGLEAIEIQNAAFDNHYNNVCQAVGLPATVTAQGTATGLVEQTGPGAHRCVTFEGHKDHMKITFPPVESAVDIEGTVCITKPAGLTLTPHA